MNLPRLGNAIIINNVSRSEPGSEADVKRLKEAYETVGFDVYVYRDCTVKVIVIFFQRIKHTMMIILNSPSKVVLLKKVFKFHY